MKDPVEVLLRGAELLQPTLGEAGFTFSITDHGKSSGGNYAQGEFRKGHRALSLSYRHSLGNVVYSVGEVTLSHEDYMWACGITAQYPGYSNDDLLPFEHLRADLASAGEAFLVQPEVAFERLLEKCQARPPKRGFRALGDPR